MALSLDSKVKDILRSPEGKAVMEKYTPGSTSNTSLKLVGAMNYRKLLSYPESSEVAKFSDQIDADLKPFVIMNVGILFQCLFMIHGYEAIITEKKWI